MAFHVKIYGAAICILLLHALLFSQHTWISTNSCIFSFFKISLCSCPAISSFLFTRRFSLLLSSSALHVKVRICCLTSPNHTSVNWSPKFTDVLRIGYYIKFFIFSLRLMILSNLVILCLYSEKHLSLFLRAFGACVTKGSHWQRVNDEIRIWRSHAMINGATRSS